ncbi:MAG: hypothetical protein ACOCVF_02790 [bacterium]
MTNIKNNPRVREKFNKYLSENLFGFKSLAQHDIEKYYGIFIKAIEYAETHPLFMKLGKDLPEKVLKQIEEYFIDDLDENLEIFCNENFGKKRIDEHGICLKYKLIGAACQLINTNEYGIIRETCEDEKCLMVDFGYSDGEIKVDIDQLIIAGQKLKQI